MHIGIVIYGSINQTSGGYLYDRKIVEHLRREGHTVTVFSQPCRDAYGPALADNMNRSFWQSVVDADLDVLLQDELNHLSLAGGNWWYRQKTNVPIVAIVHHLKCSEPDTAVRQRVAREIERLYLSSVDGFVYNSAATKKSVESLRSKAPYVIAPPSGKRFGVPPSTEHIRSRCHQDGPLRVVFVGNIIPRKQPLRLIDALARLDLSNWHLDIVGNTTAHCEYARNVHDRIAALGLHGCIRVHGKLPNEELKSLLLQSHVLVVPSTYEGFGIVYVEGMGHGLPGIATPRGGPKAIIKHGETGFLAEDPLEKTIASHLTTLANDRALLTSMSLHAREWYMRSPSWRTTGEKVHQFLSEL